MKKQKEISGTNLERRHSGTKKQRIDLLLVEQGLVSSRVQAQALLMAGLVFVNGQVVNKPGTLVPVEAMCMVHEKLPYVSRGGLKLAYALNTFGLEVHDKIVLDVGASTGGFTDCLLQRGARKVFAVDVGRGQLAWQLRQDKRVVVLEKTNIRYLEHLSEVADCATIDVSFISLQLVLPPTFRLLGPSGWVIALIKPQFEAGKIEADRGEGVITDPAVHQFVLTKLIDWSRENGLLTLGLIVSPITGREGNHEYLLYLSRQGSQSGAGEDSTGIGAEHIAAAIREAVGPK